MCASNMQLCDVLLMLQVVILDESHCIKNSKVSSSSLACKALAAATSWFHGLLPASSQSSRWYLVSGTAAALPVELQTHQASSDPFFPAAPVFPVALFARLLLLLALHCDLSLICLRRSAPA
jgi:hypothetical protein